jgi:hypothetical protein
MTNIYTQHAKQYLEKGYSVIPDKYMMKMPAIKQWSKYCYELPTEMEVEQWSNTFQKSNLAIALGPASGIIALDIDATDPKILEVVMPILPESPVVKIGSKGETRFFRYFNESSQTVTFNKEVVLEVLAGNKKTTIPPSVHPNGAAYKWKDKTLLDVAKDSLPLLPPMLLSHVESKLKLAFPDLESAGNFKTISGRNNVLSSLCSKLIAQGVPVDEALQTLIEEDKKLNDTPLFSDSNEMMHTEPYTNAGMFYFNHLSSFNSRRFQKNEEYQIPITASAVNKEVVASMLEGKSRKVESQKSLNSLESYVVLTAHGKECLQCGKLRKR